MDSIEVPQYFTCPISLQIIKDPVTTITGITYDRESIERWLFTDTNSNMCPVTKQPLPRDSDLTPNHTLRRLIQAWCDVHASSGVERIPTPRAPVDGPRIHKLVHRLSVPQLQLDSLKLIAALARENESNRRCMVQSGVAGAIVDVITSCAMMKQIDRIDVALSILHSLRVPPDDLKPIVDGGIVDSMTWILLQGASDDNCDVRSTATLVLKSMIEVSNPRLLELLKPDFFRAVLSVVRDRISQQVTKAALQVLLHACQWGGNRIKIVEAGGAKEIVELELTMPHSKRTTELNLGVLNQLCMCADGRAELVGHAAGIATVSKRILRVSSLADDQGVRILSSLCRHSATNEMLQEMLSVGAVSKLCFVLQANCSSSVKEKARWVLRLHSGVWKDSPCVQAYLLSRYP